MQILWAVCVYMEAVSVLPQLRMMQNSKVVERFTAHYVFCLGLSRFFSCAHWILQVGLVGVGLWCGGGGRVNGMASNLCCRDVMDGWRLLPRPLTLGACVWGGGQGGIKSLLGLSRSFSCTLDPAGKACALCVFLGGAASACMRVCQQRECILGHTRSAQDPDGAQWLW